MFSNQPELRFKRKRDYTIQSTVVNVYKQGIYIPYNKNRHKVNHRLWKNSVFIIKRFTNPRSL